MKKSPKILIYDIETAPILSFVWKIWKENIGVKQIVRDWHVIAWAAKWHGEKKIFYRDQRKAGNMEDDKELITELYAMLNEADVVVTHNGRKFDNRKVNARLIVNGFKPVKVSKQEDTCVMAKKYFGFTSNSLEFLSDKINKKFKKLKHDKFPGFELWAEVLKGNLSAWKEMERYNKHDVLATEELYDRLKPWSSTHFGIHQDEHQCKCGSTDLERQGYNYTLTGKYQQYRCRDCGHWSRSTKRVRVSSRTGVAR